MKTEIHLSGGYRDTQGTRHQRVVFGKRPTGKELFAIDSDPQAGLSTQYNDLIIRVSITAFGKLTMPVPLTALLALDACDRDDLNEAYERFLNESLGDRKVDFPSDEMVKLAFGYEANGLTYDVATFGQMTTGYDLVEADRLGLDRTQRACFLIGKQITRLSQSEGTSVLEGPIGLNIFERLDAIDIHALQIGAAKWKSFFRLRRGNLQTERAGKNGLSPDAGYGPA